MKQEKKIDIKRIIIAVFILILFWRLGVYAGVGALIGGAIGGILVFIIFKIIDKLERR